MIQSVKVLGTTNSLALQVFNTVEAGPPPPVSDLKYLDNDNKKPYRLCKFMADYFDMVIQVKFLQRDQDYGHALL